MKAPRHPLKYNTLTALTLSALATAVLLCAGCPKNGTHTPSTNENKNGAGKTNGKHPRETSSADLKIPQKLPDIVAFAKKHSSAVDDAGRQKATLEAVKKGLKQDPKNLELLLLGMKTACRLGILSDSHALMGSYGTQAMEWGKVAMALDPTKVAFPYYLAMGKAMKLQANSKGALDKLPEVVTLAKKAIELDAKYDYAGPLRFLGALYVQAPEMGSIGDKDKGIDHLKKAVAHFPDYPINRFYLGEAYYKDEQYDKAKKELQKVLSPKDDAPWSPRDRDYYQKKAKSYLKLIRRKQEAGMGV